MCVYPNRPDGEVAGASVGTCSCSSGGSRVVALGPGPVTTARPPPNGTRRTNRSELPTEASATTTENAPAERTKVASQPRRLFRLPATDPKNAASSCLPSPSASPRYGPSLKAVGGVCQGTLSRLDKPHQPSRQSSIGVMQKPKRAEKAKHRTARRPPYKPAPTRTRAGAGRTDHSRRNARSSALKVSAWVTLRPCGASLTSTSLLFSMASAVRLPLTSNGTIASESPWMTRVGTVKDLSAKSAAAGVSQRGDFARTATGSFERRPAGASSRRRRVARSFAPARPDSGVDRSCALRTGRLDRAPKSNFGQ